MENILDKNPKEEFIQNIKKWVIADSQLKLLHEKTKQIREIKHKITEDICNFVEDHNINQNIEISDGELKIYEKKEYSTLTYSYLEECLDKIIKNSDHKNYILQYVKDNREIVTSLDIRRTIRK